MPNFYEILGVSKEATDDEIKKAYRDLAFKNHPDRNQDKKEEAEKRFKEISEAYTTLSDPHKRAIYDSGGTQQQPFNPFGGGVDGFPFAANGMNINDIFSVFFNGENGGFNIKFPKRNPQVVIRLTLKDMIHGKSESIEGTFNGVHVQSVIDIPPGLIDGNVLRVAINGPNGEQIPLDVLCQAEIDPKYELGPHGTVNTELLLTYTEAVLGCIKALTLLDDIEQKIRIPAGVSPGQFIKIRGAGLPKNPFDLERGDFLFHVKIKIPKGNITEKQKEYLEKLDSEIFKQ